MVYMKIEETYIYTYICHIADDIVIIYIKNKFFIYSYIKYMRRIMCVCRCTSNIIYMSLVIIIIHYNFQKLMIILFNKFLCVYIII